MRRILPVVIAISLAAFAADSAWAWVRPVSEPVSDQWRAPEHQYGPGNRGVDFQTQQGSSVVTAGPGVVSFAGAVGGQRYVVVDHGDGLRTTYGNLDSIDVQRDQVVNAGDLLGTAAGSLHFGLRSGNAYVDPNSLFGKSHLVPTG